MKKLSTFFLTYIFLVAAMGQEKPPEVGDDFASLVAGDTVSVNVMANDWCMEGHTMKILSITQGEGGACTWMDSTITYSSHFYYLGTDTVIYRLKDESNGLISSEGYLVVSVENEGRKSLDVNNIDATFNSFGFQFCTLPGNYPEFNVPKGSGLKTIFCFSLWMGGFSETEQLHLAAERYRNTGTDYYPGPVSNLYLNSQYIDWNLVSRISRDDIEYHRAHWWEGGYQPTGSILSWPAHGNAFFGQADELAPFYDHDGDEMYDPLQGDFPLVRGDLALWNVYNDDMAPHGESGGERIGAEVHMMGYAFDCPDDSIFNNTIFMQYQIINRSANAYHDFYLTSFTDLDLGYPWDDYVGCDTSLQCYFVYNADDFDESDDFYGFTGGYGDHPPVQGVVFLNHPMSSFIATNNFNSIFSDPFTPEGYYNIMTGFWRGGDPITYGGTGYGGDIPVKFIYPGDPLNQEEWSEVSAGTNPEDRRGIGSTGPFDLLPGDTLKLDLAFVFARDFNGNNLTGVTLLKERVAMLRWYYDNDTIPCGKKWSSVKEPLTVRKKFKVFPNPSTEYLQVNMEDGAHMPVEYKIKDISGKTVIEDEIDVNGERIPTSRLSKGIYIIEISGGGDVIRDKFIKK